MFIQRCTARFSTIRRCFFIGFLLSSNTLQASFIESTMGAAIVDDATASYYNPAALTLLKKPQIISLGSIGNSQTQFSGQSTQLATSFIQSGTSSASLNYFLPSVYLGMPLTHNVIAGVAVVANDFNRDIDERSILRYAQSSNQIQDIDVVPAIGFKLNQFISFGAGLNRSWAHFLLQPISGLPSLNIPDSQSRNDSSGEGWGGDVGLLIKPTEATILGFNYRSAITYGLKGTSTFNGYPRVTSNHYYFKYWTPARSVFSINHFITPQLGLMGTVQFIQWSIFKDVTLDNIATSIGILPSANVHFNFHDTWLITLGANYRMSPKWIIRAAGSYTQAPSNGKFQIDNGDSISIGGSTGYTLFENIILDCSYAHAFIRNQAIHTTTTQNSINGINKGAVNAVAVKLTINI